MADNQVVIAFRISEEVSERIETLMKHMGAGEASRSQVARKALEQGLMLLEQQFANEAPSSKSVMEELVDLRRRVEALESHIRKKPFLSDA